MWKFRRLEITGGFLLLWAAALAVGTADVVGAVLCAAALHEAGHLAALRAVGVKVERIRLGAFGACIVADTRYLHYGREILCTLAGPAVNVVSAVLLSRLCGAYPAAGVHVLQGAFNLLPMPGLDGGRALFLALCWRFDPAAAEKVCRAVGGVLGCFLLGASLWLSIGRGAGLFLPLAAFGAVFGQLPLVKRRENS